MSEKEQKVLDKLAEAIVELPEEKKPYVLALLEGAAAMASLLRPAEGAA